MKEFKFISEDIILPYKEYCLTIGSWTPHRRSCLHCFDTYCFENWPGTMELTQEMVDKWCSKRPTEKISTMGARIRPIQHFLRYLRERGRTTLCDPKIPPVKRHSADIPHHFTEDELCDFFYACDHAEFYWQHGRNSQNLRLTLPVFFRLLYSSGIRPMGARMLKREDVNLVTGVVSIRKTKGANQHFIVLHDTMRTLMERYDHAIDEIYPDRTYFFPNRDGGFHSNQWVGYHFRKLWAKVSDSHAVPYSFRHNYAIQNINRWTSKGLDFNSKFVYLSKSMGHSELEHTKYYYSLVPIMADILGSLTEETFDEMIPEVDIYEESK